MSLVLERGAYEHSSVVRQAPYSPNGEGRRGSGQGGVPDPRYTQHREEPPAADAYDSDEEISLAYDQHERKKLRNLIPRSFG